MEIISILEAKDHFPELVEKAESGEMIVLTRDGAPVVEIKPAPRKKGGIRWEALEEFKKKRGIDTIFPSVPENFDDPLPEDFLIRPLPPDA